MPRDRRKGWSRTDYLAKAFDTEDLAHGVAWVLAQGATGPSGGLLDQQARERAEARFAAPVVVRRSIGRCTPMPSAENSEYTRDARQHGLHRQISEYADLRLRTARLQIPAAALIRAERDER